MNSIKEKFIPFNLKCNNLVELEIKNFFQFLLIDLTLFQEIKRMILIAMK